jgi:hypothetical protein
MLEQAVPAPVVSTGSTDGFPVVEEARADSGGLDRLDRRVSGG